MPQHDQSGGAVNKPSILVCDDEESLRAAVRLILEREYDLRFAADGEAALAAYEARGADLVLLDIKLPGKDGLAVLQELMQRSPAPRVVMLTAYQSVELAQRATQAGAMDYITKPFERQTLWQAVAQALSRPPPASLGTPHA